VTLITHLFGSDCLRWSQRDSDGDCFLRSESSTELLVPPALTLELYRKLLTVFYIEERMKSFVKQGKCSFHASTRGHEKLQIGMTMLLRPKHDWFFTYYRSKAIAVGLGVPAKDIFLGMLGREGDPNSNGRNIRSTGRHGSSVWFRGPPSRVLST